jgi:RNA polymerase sporulation-specific sigma factor
MQIGKKIPVSGHIMDILKTVSDDELWARASGGDFSAEEELVTRYTRLVRMCARPFFLAGGDSDDLIQEGMMGLLSAVRKYDPERKASFKTYAEICIRSRILDAIKSAERKKNRPLNDYVPFQSPQLDEMFTTVAYDIRDPEEYVIANESAEEIKGRLYGSLSRFEKTVLDCYLSGMSYPEMAAYVGKPVKSVDNAVQRIRKKLTQQIKIGDYSEN